MNTRRDVFVGDKVINDRGNVGTLLGIAASDQGTCDEDGKNPVYDTLDTMLFYVDLDEPSKYLKNPAWSWHGYWRKYDPTE